MLPPKGYLGYGSVSYDYTPPDPESLRLFTEYFKSFVTEHKESGFLHRYLNANTPFHRLSTEEQELKMALEYLEEEDPKFLESMEIPIQPQDSTVPNGKSLRP